MPLADGARSQCLCNGHSRVVCALTRLAQQLLRSAEDGTRAHSLYPVADSIHSRTQRAAPALLASVIVEYEQALATLQFNGDVPLGQSDITRIIGSKGTLVWCFEDLNYLDYYSTEDPDDRRGFRRIIATEGAHPYAGAWWPPGHMLGYDHAFSNACYDLVQAIAKDKSCSPCFKAGAQCVAVLEAVDKANGSGKWEKVEVIE